MKKMIFILLFISLTCSVCETFEVRSAQSFYQVFKNENVTLEWTFTNSSLDSLQIFCYVFTDHHPLVLLEYDKGVELPHNGPFEGRVLLDKDVLRERRIRLHVSSLSTEDSGLYSCEVKTSEGFGEASCRVNVTDKLQTTPETRTETGPEPEDRHTEREVWIGLGVGLSVIVLCICVFIFICLYKTKLTACCVADTGGKNADRVTSEAGRVDKGTKQMEHTRQKPQLSTKDKLKGVLNLHESSSSVRSHGHHVPTEPKRQTLKATSRKLPVNAAAFAQLTQRSDSDWSTDPILTNTELNDSSDPFENHGQYSYGFTAESEACKSVLERVNESFLFETAVL